MKIDKISLLKAGLPINEKGMAILLKRQQMADIKKEIFDLEQWFVIYDRKIAELLRNMRLVCPAKNLQSS